MDTAKIMIVEDNTTVAEDARECLEGLGYTVSSIAASGKEAIESAEKDRPDAVLMDIRLRGEMDGIEAAEKIYRRLDIPVLFLSAFSDDDLLRRAKSAGSFGYLVKPFEERELIAMLEMTLYKSGVEKERRRMAERLQESEEQLKRYSASLEEMVAERTRKLEEAQAKLLVKDRLAVLGHFAGSISHELRNPLAVIDASVYFLDITLGGSNEKVRRHLARITSSIRKSTEIIESLRRLSRMDKPKTEAHDLSRLVSRILAESRVPDGVAATLNAPEAEVFVEVDPEQIRMVLENIILNGVQAMDGAGELTATIRRKAGAVELRIADSGPGISPENLARVFDPLFSTKTHGIGFGLSLAKMIVESHGGTIRAGSEPGSGAVFIITLPDAKRPS